MNKFDMIIDLMTQLKEEMEYGEDDFNERLGREKKPKVEMMAVEGEMPMDGDEEATDGLCENEEGGDLDLKKRLAKIRG